MLGRPKRVESVGRLRHRVLVQELVPGNDFDTKDSWLTLFAVYADLRPMRAAEVMEARKVGERTTHTVTMRYRKIDTKWRLVHDNTIYHISGIINVDQRDRYIELLCMDVGELEASTCDQ